MQVHLHFSVNYFKLCFGQSHMNFYNPFSFCGSGTAGIPVVDGRYMGGIWMVYGQAIYKRCGRTV